MHGVETIPGEVLDKIWGPTLGSCHRLEVGDARHRLELPTHEDVRYSCSKNQVQRTHIVGSRNVIHQMLGVFENHGPQFGSHSLRPSKLGMQHHCSGK